MNLEKAEYRKISTTKSFFEYVKIAYELNGGCDGTVRAATSDNAKDPSNLTKIDVNQRTRASKEKIPSGKVCHLDPTRISKITGTDATLVQAKNVGENEDVVPEKELIITADVLRNRNVSGEMANRATTAETDRTRDRTSAAERECANSGEKTDMFGETLRNHLSDVLHEGLLDSVVPYMLPKSPLVRPTAKKTASQENARKTIVTRCDMENCTPVDIKESAENGTDNCKLGLGGTRKAPENQVEIHVCDKAKNIKRDFRCPQKLLVQKMRYFADVTAGQRLEEIDISVHCDVLIFDWLMRWVKKEDIVDKFERPILETSNVIPIMVSASFLQMEPLLEHCLQYCHKNMSDILKLSTVLTRLNDDLLTRLADFFSNEDVEALKDRKDKIQSRLFCKLILSLSNRAPSSKKGHYSSLASMFRCGKCKKMVIKSVSELIPCAPSAMRIDNKGNVRSKHARDSTWNLSGYITALRHELRTWRKVYWRLWGDCHFLFCQQCKMYFPMGQIDWCCYHSDSPQFFINEQQRPTPFPLGRYPCCSQRAYRFQSLQNQEGCKYKEHSPLVNTEDDTSVLNIFTAYRELISTEPPQLFFPEKITRLIASNCAFRSDKLTCKEAMWWKGLALVPSRPKLGLFGKHVWGRWSLRNRSTELRRSRGLRWKNGRNIRQTGDSTGRYSDIDTDDDDDHGNDEDDDEDDDDNDCHCDNQEEEEGEQEDVEENMETEDDNDSSTADESCRSEESNARFNTCPSTSICKKKEMSSNGSWNAGRYWRTSLPLRYNQDNQRDFEERATIQMVSLLTRRIPTESDISLKSRSKQQNLPWKNNPAHGGTYARLEAEFRDQCGLSCKHRSLSNRRNSTRTRTHRTA